MRPTLAVLVALWAALAVSAAVPFDLPVAAVAADGSRPAALYASTSADGSPGFFRSTDGGANWTPIYLLPAGTVQPLVRAILIARDNSSIVYAATRLDQGGVWRTDNRGAAWKRANGGLPAGSENVEQIYLSLQSPRTLYARVGTRIYKTTNGGDTWTVLANLPVASATGWFAVNPAYPSIMYFAVDEVFYRSTDEGATWTRGASLHPCGQEFNSQYRHVSILAPPWNPSEVFTSIWQYTVWAGWEDDPESRRWCHSVFRSGDQGGTFDGVFGPWRPSSVVASSEPGLLYLGGVLYLVPTSPGPPHKIPYQEFFSSENSGRTWNGATLPKGAFAGGPGGSPHCTAVSPADPRTVYAPCSLSGLCRSTDAGKTWARVEGNTPVTFAQPEAPLSFTLQAGEVGTRVIGASVAEYGKLACEFTVGTAGAGWLTVSASAARTPADLTIRASAGSLALGDYSADVRVQSSQCGFDATVPVRLRVVESSGPAYIATLFAGTRRSGTSGDGGPASSAEISIPRALAFDAAGGVYIAQCESKDAHIRRVSRTGVISTVAGPGAPGAAASIGLSRPSGLAVDSQGSLYISDWGNSRIMKLASAGAVSTVLNNHSSFTYPRGMKLNRDGDIVAADDIRDRVARITPTGGVSILRNGADGAMDVAIDASGNVFVAESGSNRIVKIAAGGTVTTVAGTGVAGYGGDGVPATSALLNQPEGVAVDRDGNLYISDTDNQRVRMVGKDGIIHTIAGSGARGSGGADGPARSLEFYSPSGIIVDAEGAVYVSDTYNNRVWKLTSQAPSSLAITGTPRNAADLTAGLAPGSLAVIDGAGLADAEAEAAGAPWPLELGGASVTVGGARAPLYRAARNRLGIQIPYDVPPGPTTVTVSRGIESASVQCTIAQNAPAVFAGEGGRALAVNWDGSLNAPGRPAAAGSILMFYLTGLGALDNAVAAGAAAPQDPLSRPAAPVSVRIGGAECRILYLGLTPGGVGLAQANVVLPELASGDHELAVRIGQADARPALVSVRGK